MNFAMKCCRRLSLPSIFTCLQTRRFLQRADCCRWELHHVWQTSLFVANYPCIYRSQDLHTTRSDRQLLAQTRSRPSPVAFLHRTGSRTNSPVTFGTTPTQELLD